MLSVKRRASSVGRRASGVGPPASSAKLRVSSVKRRALLPLLTALACAPPAPQEAAPEPQPVRDMPALRVEQVARTELPPGQPLGIEVSEARPGQEPRVTLTATDTDVRVLLVALAEVAGVDLVLAPGVQGRVSVHFEDVPALEALRQLVLETGHMITEPPRVPFAPTVFYTVPMNINEMGAEAIRAHFGVSDEMARFIVRARVVPK